LQAVEAGAAKAIDGADDLAACKKAKIRELTEEYGLSQEVAAAIVDTLALVLRGDTSKTVTVSPSAEKAATEKTVASSTNGNAGAEKNTFTDPRDGKVYKTIKIGRQVWLAENLNYDAPGSVCYDNDPKNGEEYGRLYNWETARKACPPGWHLPGRHEWGVLSSFIGGDKTAGKHLKSISGWKDNGIDDFGFAALPGGFGKSIGDFNDAGDIGYWWSSSEYGRNSAYYLYMTSFSEDVEWGHYYDINSLLSVRCVQD
jgi:uncharacterized protein (TIGR02145 family)